MMGYGATGPMVWMVGALAMVIIWGGVWWGLSALVFHWPPHERAPSATGRRRPHEPHAQPWQQPTFTPNPGGEVKPGGPQGPSGARPSVHQPHMDTESDYR